MLTFIQLNRKITDRTKIGKGNKSGGDTIAGHLTQAWQKPRGVPIPVTQVSFGGKEGDGGGDEVVASLSTLLTLRLRVEFSSLKSSISCSSLNIFLHSSCLFSARDEKG